MVRSATTRFLGIVFAALSMGIAACNNGDTTENTRDSGGDQGDTAEEAAKAEEAANRDLLHRYHVEIWEEGHPEKAADYMGPGFTSHAFPVSMPHGQQAGPDFMMKFFAAFPDLTSHEDAIFSKGDRVSLQWTLRGTQTVDFFGIAPTGRQIEVSGMDVLRVENGKFVEHWGGVADQMDDIIAQLTAPDAAEQAARAEEAANRDLLHRYHVEIWEGGHPEKAADYMGPGFTSHAFPVSMPNGQQAGPDFMMKFFAAFPDLTSHEDAIFSQGDRVSLQWTLRGTQTVDFFGIAPTGRQIEVSGMDVLRVENGKFVEHWGGVADQMDDIIAQLTGPASP
jgi:predicted ester cyclase